MSTMYRDTAKDLAARIIGEGHYRENTLWLISRGAVGGYHFIVFPCKRLPKKLPGIYKWAITDALTMDKFAFFMEAIETDDVDKLAEEIEYKRNAVAYSRFAQKPLPDIMERII